MLEVLPAGKNSAEQDGGVDRGNLGIPDSFAGVKVGKVVEESPMGGQLFPKKTQASHDTLACVGERNIAPLVSNAESRQPKASRGNTSHYSGVIDVKITSVFDHSGLRVGLLPEIEEICFLQFLQQLVIRRGKICLGGRTGGLKMLLRRSSQKRPKACCKRQGYTQAGAPY